MEFCRTSLTGDVMDVGVHDLDLFCHLLQLQDVPECWWEGELLVANTYGVEGRFRWPATNERERSIVVTTQTKSLSADLIDQQMDGQQIEPEWPVAKELTAFLVGDRPDSVVAHDWLTHITGDYRRPTDSSTDSSSFKPIA